MKLLKHPLLQKLWIHRVVIFLLVLLFAIAIANTFHEEYPDEYDSILGGRYFAEGKIQYRDWFQHHQPGAYLLAGVIYIFSGQSFVKFRIGLAIAFFLINAGSYLLLKRRLNNLPFGWYFTFLYILTVSATYFWGQMLLADTLATYLLIPAFTLLLMKTVYKKPILLGDVAIISFYTFSSWATSMTTSFLVGILLLYTCYQYLHTLLVLPKKKRMEEGLRALALIVVPYILFFGFFFLIGSIKEWYFANITYNSRYYIYNYPKPYGAPINPVRYATVIAKTFLDNYILALAGVAGVPLGDPLQTTIALSSIALFVYLLIRRHYAFAITLFFLLTFSTARSNPQNLRETDYQSFTYVALSMISAFSLLSFIFHDINKKSESEATVFIGKALLLVVGTFWLFTTLQLTNKFILKMHAKYMGTAPFIYNRPEVAPIINQLVSKNDYAWIGPFDFKELYYLNAKIPTRYHWFLNHAKASDKMRTEILHDFETHPAKVIVFRRNFAPWGGRASDFNDFYTDYLDKYYVRVFELNQTFPDYEYKWTIGNSEHFDYDGTIHLRKENVQELIKKLESLGYIKKVPKQK